MFDQMVTALPSTVILTHNLVQQVLSTATQEVSFQTQLQHFKALRPEG